MLLKSKSFKQATWRSTSQKPSLRWEIGWKLTDWRPKRQMQLCRFVNWLRFSLNLVAKFNIEIASYSTQPNPNQISEKFCSQNFPDECFCLLIFAVLLETFTQSIKKKKENFRFESADELRCEGWKGVSTYFLSRWVNNSTRENFSLARESRSEHFTTRNHFLWFSRSQKLIV